MKITYLPTLLTLLILLSVSVFSQKLVIDESFAPSINGGVNLVEILDNQKILIAGDFTTVNNQTSPKLALLNQDGTLDTSFSANWIQLVTNPSGTRITAINVQPDGKILVAGEFPENSSDETDKVLRLNTDGTFDTSLTTIPLIDHSHIDRTPFISKVQPLADGKFFVCGFFDLANGNSQSHLARYNNDGSVDTTLTTEFDDVCFDVEVQPDDKYLVAGVFTTVNGDTREGLARFNSDDSVDTGFTAWSVNSQFYPDQYKGIELNDDGTIYAFHDYLTYGFFLRLNANGSLRTRYLTSVDAPGSNIGDAEILPNGKVIAVGDFFNAGRTATQSDYFNRFTPDGRHDGSINRINFYGAYQATRAVEIAADEKVIVGGYFNRVNTNGANFNQPHLARFVPQPVPIQPKFDFDGDGRDDLAVYRPSDRVWYINQSTNGFTSRQFGLSTDIPVAADYDQDGKADIAVFRDGAWYWMRSSDNTFAFGVTGQAGDIPQGGFIGRFHLGGTARPDGTPGLLVFRPSQAKFYLQNPYEQEHAVNVETMPVTSNDIPVSADYDGDGKDDVAIFQAGNWYYLSSNDFRVWHYQFGIAGDKPAIGDFDGDGRSDYAVYRPSNGVWYISQSTDGFRIVRWGLENDIPVPADYDGDGKTDIAIYREGVWYIVHNDNSTRIEQFGLSGDIPIPAR